MALGPEYIGYDAEQIRLASIAQVEQQIDEKIKGTERINFVLVLDPREFGGLTFEVWKELRPKYEKAGWKPGHQESQFARGQLDFYLQRPEATF